MTTPRWASKSGRDRCAGDGTAKSSRNWRQLARRLVRGRRRRWALASLLSFWLALLALALPLSAHADANSLASYGATASGWAIQPYILNDSFLNVPAADQSAPYVFVSMDNTPGAQAKASYFFPGTAVNAVPNTQGVPVTVPAGVEARYPGTGSASGQVGLFDDGVATQAAAGAQSAKASEGYALAQAGIAHYQFAPTIPMVSAPGAPPLPSPPPIPTVPGGGPTPTATSGSGGGGTPTATPGSGKTPTPTSTPKPCILPPICLSNRIDGHAAATRQGAQAPQGQQGLIPIKLPNDVEKQLTDALKAAEIANPALLKLAGGHLAATDDKLPYASADASSQAATRATDGGVGVTVVTRAEHIQLLQGLITLGSVESVLQAVAPASKAHGSGTITTRITGAAIAGIPVKVDENGVTINDQGTGASQIQALSDQLNTALAKAGIHMALVKSVTKSDSGFWEGAGAGLEVIAELNPAGAGLPSPASGVPATHADFSIGKVSASMYATPNTSSSGGGGGDGGGSCFFCGDSGSGDGNVPNANTPSPTKRGNKTFSLLGGLNGGELLALVFVVQGVSTAAVAATAGYTDSAARAAKAPTEEETK